MNPDRRTLAAVFAGGFAGALTRGLLVEALPYSAHRWPWVTFGVNVAGAALLGYLVARPQRESRPGADYRVALLGTGFCGALTTFSTLQLELVRMLDVHEYLLAGGYCLASTGLGYLAVGVITTMTRRERISLP